MLWLVKGPVAGALGPRLPKSWRVSPARRKSSADRFSRRDIGSTADAASPSCPETDGVRSRHVVLGRPRPSGTSSSGSASDGSPSHRPLLQTEK